MPRRTLALALLIASWAMTGRGDEDMDDVPTISVSGTGKVSAAPDIAEISVGVVTQAETARDALSANNQAMTALRNVLKERGVAEKDIQTTNISVNPRYSQPPQPRPNQAQREFVPKIVGYEVRNQVQITGRDITKLGVLLDAVVQAGANQMHGISFRIDEPEKLLDQARKKAMADAKRKAEQLAGEAGVVVGSPIRIQEGGAPAPPSPQPMMGRAFLAAAPSEVPVAGGEQDLSVTVHVVYELKAAK
jgi:uncharacterized protein